LAKGRCSPGSSRNAFIDLRTAKISRHDQDSERLNLRLSEEE
jgi:hypothetical protein